MNIIQRPSPDFVNEITIKKLLILHFTAGGTLAGSEATLAKRDKVNVCYQVDRDGTPYQYFEEKYWAYATGSGKHIDKVAVQVEFVCWGPLKRKGNALYAWPKNWGVKVPWSEAIRLEPWRGFEYWHILTPAQEQTAQQLVPLIRSHWELMEVATHAFYRKDKFDFPPDYPLIKDLVTLK